MYLIVWIDTSGKLDYDWFETMDDANKWLELNVSGPGKNVEWNVWKFPTSGS